jgi:GT2 family glycosyltransferase
MTDQPRPELSVVTLAWNNLDLTRAFVDSVRACTDVSYELIVVDNGSERDAAEYARTAADEAILNAENRGFAAGMNQGLAAASGEFVAFCNNDTVLPRCWASRLLETARRHPSAAVVVPAITAASNPRTVRSEPGEAIETLDPFSAPPPAVVYLMRRAVVAQLGGWEEEYRIASGEDVDLCFKVWVNDLDVVFDQRVLVEHVGHASARHLDDWERRWMENRTQFLAKWSSDVDPPRVPTCDAARFARNRATARSTAIWMEKYFTIRDRRPEASGDTTAGKASRRLGRRIKRQVWRS